MDEITIQAPAKLNLTLDVLGRREDGYHDLKMVMQSITLADRLTLRPGRAPGIQVSSSFHFLPTGEKNLAGKAAVCFYQALGRPARDLDISITKHVPVCAGMAGGSSDAAAVLRALNRLEGDPFSPEELAHVGEAVGSDVPYCVLGCTALAQGRGEVLTPLSPLPHCWVVACKPDFPVSTPELYQKNDTVAIPHHPDNRAMETALQAGDLQKVAENVYNVFDPVVTENHLELNYIKSICNSYGALCQQMTGSGSAVFAMMPSFEYGAVVCNMLQENYPQIFMAKPV